jgi:hypothetical protein
LVYVVAKPSSKVMVMAPFPVGVPGGSITSPPQLATG